MNERTISHEFQVVIDDINSGRANSVINCRVWCFRLAELCEQLAVRVEALEKATGPIIIDWPSTTPYTIEEADNSVLDVERNE